MSNITNLRLRIPPKLYAMLKHEAKHNQRSLNSEIIYRLTQSPPTNPMTAHKPNDCLAILQPLIDQLPN
jgi:hypothetical protein